MALDKGKMLTLTEMLAKQKLAIHPLNGDFCLKNLDDLV